MQKIPTATLLVAYTHQDEQEQAAFDALAKRLARRLAQPVVACALDQPDRTVLHAITGLLQQGAVKICILPLFLSPAEHRDNHLADAVVFAAGRWPRAHFHLAPPPDLSQWLRVVDALIPKVSADQATANHETVVILAGRGDGDPHINSDLVKLAWMLYEARDFDWVDVGFVFNTTPTITELLARHQVLGAKRLIVVPCMLFEGTAYRALFSQVESAQVTYPFAVTGSLPNHSIATDVLLERQQAALEDRSLLPVNWNDLRGQLVAELEVEHRRRPGQPAADEAALQTMLNKVSETLPPRRENNAYRVSGPSSAPVTWLMGDDGAVCWDQMFERRDRLPVENELALAGGASLRQHLLEAVDPAECLAEPVKYAAALAEIGRGIRAGTGLEIVESNTPGWIGVQCDGEEMAIWLVRAIIVENVMVRREGDVLYLPVGPHYRLDDEIVSIVLVVTQTWRCWIEYGMAQSE